MSTRSAGRSPAAGAARASIASTRPAGWHDFAERYAVEGIPLNAETLDGIRAAGRRFGLDVLAG